MYRITQKSIFAFFILSFFAFADTIDIIKDSFLLSLPDTSHLQFEHVTYDVSHQELLRESRNDTLLSRYALREQYVEFNQTISGYSFFVSWSRHVYDIADLFHTDYTISSPGITSNNLTFKTQAHVKNWLIQPGINYSFSRSRDTLFITDFPTSDISAYNTYFFDLLPETFGDTIPYSDTFNSFYVECLASKHMNDQKLLLHAKYSHASNQLNESHINTSSNDKLSGPRESQCKLNYSYIQLLAGWQIQAHSFFWFSTNYAWAPLLWEHTVFPSEPDTNEIIRIASGNNEIFNIQLGYRVLSKPYHLQANIGTGFIDGTDIIRTPVLGYVLRILPISHQADVALRSSYLLTHVHFDYPFYTGSLTFTPRLDMIVARCWSDINILALLQFGLQDIDLQKHYIHVAAIASIGFDATIALNRDLSLVFKANQLIPYVKTIYPEPLPPEPDGIKRYGGLSISCGISMAW